MTAGGAVARVRRNDQRKDERQDDGLVWRWVLDLQFMAALGLALAATLLAAAGHGRLVAAGIALGVLVVWWSVTRRHSLARRRRAARLDSLATIQDPVLHDRVVSLMLLGVGGLLVLIVILARLGIGS